MSIRGFLVWCCCISALPTGTLALPSRGLSRLTSPNKEYSLFLSDTDEKWVYKLAIVRSGRELAHYRFRGELISGYWSQSGKYVAINNHYGHRGWYVWIISLDNGSVIRANDTIRSPDYDRYSDIDDYGPDVSQTAKAEIERVYKGYGGDRLREGYSSVVYGWENRDRLLLFHEFTLVELYNQEHAYIDVYTVLQVDKGQQIGLEVNSVKKVTGTWESQDLPLEVKKTLNMGK